MDSNSLADEGVKMIRLALPYLPPASVSPNSRCHWTKRHRDGKVVANNVFYLLREQFATIPLLKQINLRYRIVVPDRRRRDYENFVARCKPCTDALVKAGLIPDDAPQYVLDYKLVFEVVKRKSATIIEIEVKK